MKNRSSTEIIGLILQAVETEPLTRSKIMYQAMLNFTQVTDYATFLTQEGLLTYLTLEKKYAITDKGKQLLTLFSESNKLLTVPSYHVDDNMTARSLQVQNQQQQQEVTLHK